MSENQEGNVENEARRFINTHLQELTSSTEKEGLESQYLQAGHYLDSEDNTA